MRFEDAGSALNADQNLTDAHEASNDGELTDIKKYEITPSERDEFIVADTRSRVLKIVSTYGVERVTLPESDIRLVRPGAIARITQGESTIGFYNRLTGRIVVERSQSDLGLATALSHELFHEIGQARYAGSQEYARLLREKEFLPEYGEFDMRALIEALVSELEHEFYLDVSEEKIYEEEFRATVRLKEEIAKLLSQLNAPETISGAIASALDDVYSIPESEVEEIERAVNSRRDVSYKAGWIMATLELLNDSGKLAYRGRQIERKGLDQFLLLATSKTAGVASHSEKLLARLLRTYLRGEHERLLGILQDTLGPSTLG